MTQTRRDQLREQRALDMLAVVSRGLPGAQSRTQDTLAGGDPAAITAAERPAAEPTVSTGKGPDPSASRSGAPTEDGLLLCSARELEWLPADLGLVAKGVIGTGTVPRGHVGVVSPYTPSMLFVIYRARYFLSAGSPPPATRDVYIAYGAEARLLPTSRKFGDLL